MYINQTAYFSATALNPDYGRIERHNTTFDLKINDGLNPDYGRIERYNDVYSLKNNVELNPDYGRIERTLLYHYR